MTSKVLSHQIHFISGGFGNGREEGGTIDIICGNCNKTTTYNYYIHNKEDSYFPKLCAYCGCIFDFEKELENENN